MTLIAGGQAPHQRFRANRIMVWTPAAAAAGLHCIRAREGHPRLTTFLIDLSPSDMHSRLGEALAIYVGAMRYPRGTEEQRASMWLEHSRRLGWKAVAAVESADGSS